MPKVARSTSDVRRERRHNPLGEEYSPTAPLKQKAGRKRKQSHDEEEARQDGYVDSESSRRILDLGQDLAAEDESEQAASKSIPHNNAFSFESRFPVRGADGDEVDADAGDFDDEAAWGSEEEEVEEIEVDPNDLEAFNKFNPSFDPATLLQSATDGDDANGKGGTNLTELILAKIAAHEAEKETQEREVQPVKDAQPLEDDELHPRVIEAYSHVGKFLSRYKSGKLPKPFKILPTLPQSRLEKLLEITQPYNWTPNAMYEATKIFSSSRSELAEFFNREVLLPAVQEDIRETKKLNVHLYKALKKTLYKPRAFFFGIVFPMLEEGTCTLREATIVASVVARVSIPVLHSGTAIYRLCEIADSQMTVDVESAGACNIFIRTLLEKKYALPYRVIDALVFHFLSFRSVKQSTDGDVSMDGSGGHSGRGGASDPKLPVLWHQCLLVFAQRYKNEIEEEQRDALLELLKGRGGHKDIGPEVRRELLEGRPRGTAEEAGSGLGGDDTMMDV